MKTVQKPFSQLAKAIKLKQDLYLKREDTHKYGSHKGRSIPVMIKKYLKEENISDFVISSSGNAALAAIHAVQSHNKNNDTKIKLTIFIGEKITEQKLKSLTSAIQDVHIKLKQVERPKQQAFQIDKSGEAKFLRQSTDENALEGYFELARELAKIPDLKAVFIPTSSGTTAQALGKSFEKLNKNIQIHIVQTEACHPIAQEFDTPENKTESSCAGAIVDKIAHRKNAVVDVIKNSQGSGWIVSDEEIREARKLVKNTTNIKISTNSALSVAGLKKAITNNWKFDGVVCCLVTGR